MHISRINLPHLTPRNLFLASPARLGDVVRLRLLSVHSAPSSIAAKAQQMPISPWSPQQQPPIAHKDLLSAMRSTGAEAASRHSINTLRVLFLDAALQEPDNLRLAAIPWHMVVVFSPASPLLDMIDARRAVVHMQLEAVRWQRLTQLGCCEGHCLGPPALVAGCLSWRAAAKL